MLVAGLRRRARGRRFSRARSSPADESLDHLRHELLIFLPLALLAASLGGYALAAGALRPVEVLRRRAEAVTPGEPSRLPVPPAGDEVSRLAQTLNEMLARLQAAVEHERRFVADASHELRTPLALLRTELDLALRRPRSREELESALRSAAVETQRLSRLADDLLLIARADQGPLPVRREVVAAGDLLDDAATRFANRAGSLGRELRVEETDLHVDADPLRAGQALVNLVDNALIARRRHGRAPGRGAGRLRRAPRPRWRLGLPAERSGAARSTASAAPTRRAAAAARGSGSRSSSWSRPLTGAQPGLSEAPSGGADVWISLPRADAPGGLAGRAAGRPRSSQSRPDGTVSSRTGPAYQVAARAVASVAAVHRRTMG